MAGRTETMVADVILALVSMGVNPSGIEAHARRPNHSTLPAPLLSSQPKQLSILQAGVKKEHPTHVPNNLPSFPDPHAYIRTPVCSNHLLQFEFFQFISNIETHLTLVSV